MIAATLVAALVAVAAAAVSAAQPAASKSILLGKTTKYPQSGCPSSNGCEVVARVTGVQMRADGVIHPFRVPSDGQVVAWSLKLPQMKQSQVKSFTNLFGGAPTASLAILRRGVRSRMRLVQQSPTEDLRSHLGANGRVIFRLAQPLRVKKGYYVGLTVSTWAPSFAVGLDPVGDSWLASRENKRCSTPSSRDAESFARYYRRNDAHGQTGTAKRYQCTYRTARLLYWARMIPDQAPTP